MVNWFKSKPTKEEARPAEGRPALDSDLFVYNLMLNIRGSFDLDSIFQQVAHHVGEVLRVDRCLVYLMDDEADALRWRAGYQAPGVDMVRWSFRSPDFPDLFKRLREGQMVKVTDPTRDPMMRAGRVLFQREGKASLLFVPAMSDQLESVILLNQSTGPREWAEQEIKWLELIAIEMALAARTVRLNSAARSAELQLQSSSLEFQRQTQGLQQLTQVLLHSSPEPTETFYRFAEFLVAHFRATACAIEEINDVMVNVRSSYGLGRTGAMGVATIRGTPREQVISGKKLVLLTSAAQDFPQDRLLTENNWRVYIGVPVLGHQQHVIGLLNLYHGAEVRLNEQDRILLQGIARRVAFEMERERPAPVVEHVDEDLKHQHAALLAQTAYMDTLRQVREWLRKAELFEGALDAVLDLTAQALGADFGVIALCDADQRISHVFAVGLDADMRAAISDPLSASWLELVAQQDRPLDLNGLTAHPRFHGFPPEFPSLKSFLGASLRARHLVLGAIYFADKHGGQRFSDEDQQLISDVAAEVALAVGAPTGSEAPRADALGPPLYAPSSLPSAPETWDSGLLYMTEVLMTSLSNGLVVVDADGRITVFNPVMEQLLGYHHTEVLTGLVGEEFVAFLGNMNPFATVLATGQEESYDELAMLARDGGRKLVAAKIVPLKDVDGTTTGALGLFSELTEVRAIAKEEGLAPLGLIAEMAARLAHEIKNPLASMMSGLELLQRRLSYGGQEGRYFERLIAELKRLDMTLREMLAFSRPAPLSFAPVDPSEPMERALQSVEPQIQVNHIRVIRSYAPDLPQVVMDEHQIEQVFLNLMLNGIQAMPESGTLRVSVRQVKSPDLHQKFGAEGPFLEYVIQDSGAGIPQALLPKIFDPFFSTKTHGTGLGLATVKKIIDGHQGFIGVKSQPGSGTTFTMHLKFEGPTGP
jgi:PAS domain S-box-containing protein